MRVLVLALALVSYCIAAQEDVILEDPSIDSTTQVNIINSAPLDFNLALKVCTEGDFDIEPKLFIQRFNFSKFSMTGPVFNSTAHSIRCLVQYVAEDLDTWFRLEKKEGDQNIIARSSGLGIAVVPIDSPTKPKMVSVYIAGPRESHQNLQATTTAAHHISNGLQLEIAQASGAPLAKEKAILGDNSVDTNTHVFMWNHTPKDFNLTMKMCSVGSFDINPPMAIPNGTVSARFSMTGPAFNSTVHLVLCTVEYATEDKKTWFYVKKRDGDENVSVSSSPDLDLVVEAIDFSPLPNGFNVLIVSKGPSPSLQYRPPQVAPYNVFIKATPSLKDGDDALATHVFVQNITPKEFLLARRTCSYGGFDIWPQLSIPSGTAAHFSMKGEPKWNSTSEYVQCILQYATADRRTWFLLDKNMVDKDLDSSSSPDIYLDVKSLNFPPLPNAVSVDINWKVSSVSLASRPPKGAGHNNNVFVKASKNGSRVRTI